MIPNGRNYTFDQELKTLHDAVLHFTWIWKSVEANPLSVSIVDQLVKHYVVAASHQTITSSKTLHMFL